MIIGYEAKRIYHNRSGLGNFGRNLLQALANYHPEHQYLLFNSHPGTISFGRDMDAIKEIQPAITAPIYRDVWRQSLMVRDIKKHQVELFHGLSMELPKGIKKLGIPTILSVHDVIFLRYPELYKSVDRNIYLAKLRRSLGECTRIVATSRQTRQDLIDLLNVDESRIDVIYQGVHPSYWIRHSKEEIEQIKSQFHLPDKFALFVGTLEQRKGVQHLLEAQLQTGLDIVYVGKPTTYWKDTFGQQKYQSIKEKVHTPEVRDTLSLSKIYQAAKLFVYPSIFEGFGIPVLEALVSQIPVITSNTSSLPEVAGPGSILIDPQSALSISNAIQQLWDDEEKSKECVQNSLNFIEQFKDQKLAAQWEQTYLSLLK